MVTRVVSVGLLACLGFSAQAQAQAQAQAADVKPSEFVVCKSAKSVRTLSVTPEDSKTGAKSCKVTYTKGGVPETVGQHTNKASCHSILDQVKVSLEDSKWNCRNVSARSTTSSEVSSQ